MIYECDKCKVQSANKRKICKILLISYEADEDSDDNSPLIERCVMWDNISWWVVGNLREIGRCCWMICANCGEWRVVG